ncbi:urease accessory protein UreH domain-containing protein [Actinocorallia populi]|uniref:urease accessory protein UreH domain-containing protein n=1 Tax=Actinocorallia populi TaxID=2079200 RepID=UPI0018E5A3D2|nr:sulfite exporter TauE/SafE family protein [Actinocorallia populi]
MSTATSFVTGAGMGLLAGLTTCAALHTGLLAGAASRPGARPARLVTAFLAGKFAAHTLLGALLGALGAAVQPGPRLRALLLVAAAAVLAVFALRLVRARPAPEKCAPPSRAGRPLLIGAATVLVPCGLTLSAELLAVASRSPLTGAAVMAGFVLGTAPMTGVLGLGLSRLRGLPSRLLGAALLAVAAWTALSGLRLGGWLPDHRAPPPVDARFVTVDPSSGVQTVTLHVLDRGYRPALLSADAGVPTVLVLSTRGTTGCTLAFTLPDRDVSLALPRTGRTRIGLGVPSPGRLRFLCSAGHYSGSLTFR